MSDCTNEATTYCIVEDGYDACDEHATGDYHRRYDE